MHCHTSASDGNLSSQELVARAASLGIKVLGITDHDTTAGIPAAQAEAQRQGVTLVPAVEISTLSGREEIHLLGYFIDPEYPELQALLARTREARLERAQKMLARLTKLGLPIEWDRVVEISGGSSSIGRPHVAATLVEAGHVNSYEEAFDLWIGRDCPAYVERYKLAPEEAIELVKRSGGLPVLAHPYLYSRNGEQKKSFDLGTWLPRLRDAGLDGIEVYYPNYSHRTTRHLLEHAIHYNLLITGGSDFHGGMLGNGLGSVAVPWVVWEGLERRNRARQTNPADLSPRQTRSAQSLSPNQGFV